METRQETGPQWWESAGSQAPMDAVVLGPLFLDVVFATLARLPRPGEELWCEQCSFSAGGAANQARALTRVGMDVRLRSYVGADLPGHVVRHLLEEDGIGLTDLVECEQQAVTASLSTGADRAMASAGTPLAPPLAGPHPRLLLADLRAIQANRAMVKHWRAAGTTVLADVGWDESGAWDVHDLEPLALVDIFTPNASEACHYTRTDSPEEAAAALAARVATVAVTCGADGVTVADISGTATIPAHPARVVDPTGAGDVFAAVFAASLLHGAPTRHAAHFAAVAAAMSTEHTAGQGTPTWEDISVRARADGALRQ